MANQDDAIPPGTRLTASQWLSVPLHLRHRMWMFYCPGQDISRRGPSNLYREAAVQVRRWIEEHPPKHKKASGA